MTDAEQGKAVQQGTERLRVGQWDPTTDEATGLCKLFADDLANNGRRSRTNTLRQWDKNVARHLGAERDVRTIDYATLTALLAARTKEGAAPATRRQELRFILRACKLAVNAGLLARVPGAPEFTVKNTRERFVTATEHQRLKTFFRVINAPHMVPVIEMASLIGWRRGMLLHTEWAHVDWDVGELRLPGTIRGNKAGKPVVIPFREHSGVEAILTDQRATADRIEAELGRPVTHLFFYCTRGRSRPYGGPIKSHYHAWKRACTRAGITDLVLHDYRRTGCRNLTNAGVSPVAAMSITGHRTTAMFERYNIGGTDMAAEAMRKLAAATAGEPA